MTYNIADRIPKFYGAVTVGERGQIAIPAEARRELDISPSGKLLAFGAVDHKALIFVKAEFVTELLTTMSGLLARFDQVLKMEPAAPTTEHRDKDSHS